MASATALWLVACPLPAAAQAPAFVAAVRELAEATLEERPGGIPTQRTAAALDGMRAALAEWDRSLRTLEARVARELIDASRERVFQLHVEMGLAYRQRGRLLHALREFDTASAVQPGASDVHLLRALTLEAAGRGAEAGRAFRTAWSRDAANPVKAYLALTRAIDLQATDRERAQQVLRDAYQRILSSNTRGADAPFLTLDVVPDTLSRIPVVGDAVLAGVFERVAGGRFDDAVTAFDTSHATDARDDDSPRTHFLRARTDESEGRLTEARRAYAAALAGTLAGRHALYVGIARLAQVEGELEAAITAFGRAIRLNPNDRVIRRELAAAYAEAGRADDAFAELVAALLIDPLDADALAAVGQLFLDTERAADAIPALSRTLQVKPDRFETHYALAVALARAGRTADAAREFERFERISAEALERRRRAVTGLAAPDEPRR